MRAYIVLCCSTSCYGFMHVHIDLCTLTLMHIDVKITLVKALNESAITAIFMVGFNGLMH